MEKSISLDAFIYGFIAGFILTGIVSGIIIGRSSDEIAGLNRERDKLDREYIERQSKLTDSVEQCIGYVRTARDIIERTDVNASSAVSDLRSASVYIKQGIEERENIKMELDRLRAGLYGIRNLAGVDDL